jgi:putative transposase
VADLRLAFVRCIEDDGLSIAEACRAFEISRPTGYKILSRYDAAGVAGLLDRSRAPHHCPHAVDADVVARILAVKARYSHFGPKKVKTKLDETQGDTVWPTISTIGSILKRAGLVKPRRPRSHAPSAPILSQPQHANELWCVDYKGQFGLGSGQLCYPLTMTDRTSRFLIRCHGLPDVTGRKAWPYFVGAFQEYGMPLAIRSDNGSPFATASITGLTYLSLNLIKLGIILERITPGKPQQNGAHERMHRTLKAEAVHPAAYTMIAQQQRFDAWRHMYNYDRPHEALGQKTPASAYSISPRRYPAVTPKLEYPDAMRVTRVRTNGTVKWRGRELFVSEVLVGEPVGFDHFMEGYHALYVGKQPVAILDEALAKFVPAKMAAEHIARLRKEALT